jgi:diguanylate cyclase (GGDEF)-like protein
VLALYRRPGAPAFTGAQEEAVRTLAGPAGMAADNVKLHRDAERLSITDALTGCWNFRYLSMSLAREIERATRFSRPLAVLMLDLDLFKLVNDTYGHARGDAVLREFASRIIEQVREVDTLARYGGEEFVLVLPETTPEGAAMLAERICTAVRRDPFGADSDEEPVHVTVSIGVAAFPRHGASPATLMHSADEALYVAKRSGRDTWRMASDVAGELSPELTGGVISGEGRS